MEEYENYWKNIRGSESVEMFGFEGNLEPEPINANIDGMIENFNDRYQQMFLGKVAMSSQEDLNAGSLVFEQRHNSRYRNSKLGGKTPLKALAAMNTKLPFPAEEKAPRHRLMKPEAGRYHLVRLIRSDSKLNIFGKIFPVSPELKL